MNENVMSRTKAREIALHLIFEMGFQQFEPENLEERLDENIMRSLKTDAEMYAGRLSVENADYIRAVVKGVATRVDELDGAIERNAKGWKLNRLSRMTKAVLRLAIYEMRYVSDVPVGVAINEAVEIAKKYETPETVKFINGILGSFVRAEISAE